MKRVTGQGVEPTETETMPGQKRIAVVQCVKAGGWLPCRDSNPNYLIQSQASYR